LALNVREPKAPVSVQCSLLLPRPVGRDAFCRGHLYDGAAADQYRRLTEPVWSARHFLQCLRTTQARAKAHFPESESREQLRSLFSLPLVRVQNKPAAAEPVSGQRHPASFSAV
jgi:hypothetical protein